MHTDGSPAGATSGLVIENTHALQAGIGMSWTAKGHGVHPPRSRHYQAYIACQRGIITYADTMSASFRTSTRAQYMFFQIDCYRQSCCARDLDRATSRQTCSHRVSARDQLRKLDRPVQSFTRSLRFNVAPEEIHRYARPANTFLASWPAATMVISTHPRGGISARPRIGYFFFTEQVMPWLITVELRYKVTE